MEIEEATANIPQLNHGILIREFGLALKVYKNSKNPRLLVSWLFKYFSEDSPYNTPATRFQYSPEIDIVMRRIEMEEGELVAGDSFVTRYSVLNKLGLFEHCHQRLPNMSDPADVEEVESYTLDFKCTPKPFLNSIQEFMGWFHHLEYHKMPFICGDKLVYNDTAYIPLELLSKKGKNLKYTYFKDWLKDQNYN